MGNGVEAGIEDEILELGVGRRDLDERLEIAIIANANEVDVCEFEWLRDGELHGIDAEVGVGGHGLLAALHAHQGRGSGLRAVEPEGA